MLASFLKDKKTKTKIIWLSFSHTFDFHCLTYFVKISISRRWFLFSVSYNCKLSIYTLKCDQWIAIWYTIFFVGMSTSIHWLKIQSHLQKCRLWIPVHVHQNSNRRKTVKISNITFNILHFAHNKTKQKNKKRLQNSHRLVGWT